MTVDQFKAVMCDTYLLDVWEPSSFLYESKLQTSSYLRWAVNELAEYISSILYPERQGEIDKFIDITDEFIKKMNRLVKLSHNHSGRIFLLAAKETAENAKEILRAMR